MFKLYTLKFASVMNDRENTCFVWLSKLPICCIAVLIEPSSKKQFSLFFARKKEKKGKVLKPL